MRILIIVILCSSVYKIGKTTDPCIGTGSIEECNLQKLIHRRSATHKQTGPDLIEKNGFPLEVHNITSKDGYITTLFRIPYGRNLTTRNVGNRTVVFLHHGFVADGIEWTLNSVDKALAYRLADSGFDVWMTNNRGTYFSLKHTNISWRTRQFWNFSFHEVALYDIPVILDYILNITNQLDLYYIGHSMGCSAFFAFMSLHPEYNSKIRTFIGLAPAVYIYNSETPFQSIRPILLNNQDLHDSFFQGPFVHPDAIPAMQIVSYLCSPKIISRWICFAALEAIFGYDLVDGVYDLDKEIVAVALSSTSIKTLLHLMQMWSSGKFQQYDYQEKNFQIYGQQVPLIYPLNKVNCPVVLYCGLEDRLISCKDVAKLSTILPNVKEFKQIVWQNFNHIDFLYNSNINELLNNRLLEIVINDEFVEK